MKVTKVEIGKSIERSVGFADARDLTGWNCRLQVRLASNKQLALSKNVTKLSENKTKFNAILTASETGSLIPRVSYVLAFELSSQDGRSAEITETITFTDQWVYD